jgi:two-component system NtrC family sensor kinase
MAISFQQFWARLNLSQKIVFPFLAACLSVSILGLFIVGNWFTESLEQNLHEEVKSFAERVSQDFRYEQQILENEVKLIADREDLRLAVERQDRRALMQTLLPLRATLDLEWIRVVDIQGNILFDAQASTLSTAKLLDDSISSSASSGAILGDLVDIEGEPQTLQTVIYPIKSAAGLLGGIIMAHLIDDQLLQNFAAGSSKHLIAMRNKQIIATTLPAAREAPTLAALNNLGTTQLTINQQRYLARRVSFTGASQSLFTTILYPLAQLDAAKRLLWFRFGLVLWLQAIIVAIVGVLIAQAITRPLKAVSQIAKEVTRDSNFSLQAPVLTKDEVGVVATSLNQLIQQVQQLLIEQQETKEQLEINNLTLEQQVESRTEELQQKNIDLQLTLEKLKEAQSRLIQGEKMSALGQLVAGIAHEINNPVNFIHGNLVHVNQHTQDLLLLLSAYQQSYPHPPQALQEEIERVELDFLREDLAKVLKSMKMGSDRIRDLVLSLRNFSRLDEAEFKTVNIHDGIDSALLILQHRLKASPAMSGIQIIKDYGTLPQVECYPSQLNQVFLNIINNAIDALEEKNQQPILTEDPANPSQILIKTTLLANNQVEIKITDNGLGIPASVQQRIFDPFFTTKEIGKGTGLGMSISYQIITERHHGSFRCESSLGRGASFIIRIPLQQH